MELKSTILENGFDFLLSALNNLLIAYENNDDKYTQKRLLKYALIHLSSGIELVLKYRLFIEHWTYVFADMNKSNKEALKTGDFKSVDSETIMERLRNFCEIKLKESDINELKRLRKKRNKVEHFEFNENIMSVENSIHKSISILIEIMLKHYNLDEFSEEETQLFADLKRTMRKLEQHYKDVIAIANKELEKSMQIAITCPECREHFLIRDCDVKCVFCGYEDTGESAANNYINNIMGIYEYSTIKDGGEYPLYECPQCENETLVCDYDNNCALCFSCDFESSIDKIQFCVECGMPYIKTDGDLIICNECFNYKINKDD